MTGSRKPLSAEHRARLSASTTASMTPEHVEEIRAKALEVGARPEIRAQRSAWMLAYHARVRAALAAVDADGNGTA